MKLSAQDSGVLDDLFWATSSGGKRGAFAEAGAEGGVWSPFGAK